MYVLKAVYIIYVVDIVVATSLTADDMDDQLTIHRSQ